jgi:uncharacterized alkaline shock family protein YloU
MTESETGRGTGAHAAGTPAGRAAHAADDTAESPRVNGAQATALVDPPPSAPVGPNAQVGPTLGRPARAMDSTTIIPRIPADPGQLPGARPAAVSAVEQVMPGVHGRSTALVERREPGDLPARQRGTTAIADDVVEKVAGFAAEQVDGVFDLGGDVARALNTIREKFRLGEGSSRRGVHVELAGRSVRITLTLVIQFGHPAMQVAEQVRENVIAAVETMLAMDVAEVNVIIDDVHVED